MFVKNAWYVAAWETEIAEAPLARTILSEPVVMFRIGNVVIALEDRCCHRALPLSMGQVVGDRIQCGYHGLEFDTSGVCVKVPGQTKIPSGRKDQVLSRGSALWLGLDMDWRCGEGRPLTDTRLVVARKPRLEDHPGARRHTDASGCELFAGL